MSQGYYTDQHLLDRGQYSGQGTYYGLSTDSEVFLNFTTRPYQQFKTCFLFMRISDVPEVFLPEYSQLAILHAAHFQRVVKP